MTLAPIPPEAFQDAFRRIEEWTAVHHRSSEDEREHAAGVLMAGLGVTTEAKLELLRWLEEFGVLPPAQGAALIGLVIGLHVMRYEP